MFIKDSFSDRYFDEVKYVLHSFGTHNTSVCLKLSALTISKHVHYCMLCKHFIHWSNDNCLSNKKETLIRLW